MKEQVLNFLRMKRDYVSGEEISKNLGVTRASIWKVIQKLKHEGYLIESSTKRGYYLVDVPNIVTREEVSAVINTTKIGKEIRYYEEVDSTNEVAKKLARQGEEEGVTVIADLQKGGKGRLGRVWDSPASTGIWMSTILRPQLAPYKASQITLLAGLAMCEAIEKVTGLEAKIKWPNDIVVNKKKVCGILTEMSAEMESINYIILGIGVNVNTTYFPGNLPYASSLYLEGEKEYSRKEIIKVFFEIFELDYMKYKEHGDLLPFLERYKGACITLHNKVKIISDATEYIATTKDIARDGSLIVITEDGEEKSIFTGEVSVRGLYGYI